MARLTFHTVFLLPRPKFTCHRAVIPTSTLAFSKQSLTKETDFKEFARIVNC